MAVQARFTPLENGLPRMILAAPVCDSVGNDLPARGKELPEN